MANPVILDPTEASTNPTKLADLSGNVFAKIPTASPYLNQNELKLWLNYIESQVGFILPTSQNNWVKNTIERYLRQYQLTSTELLARLIHDKHLYHQLFDDILIPRTQFFRHLPTFQFIESYARHFQQQALYSPKPLTAWSVGCASGQEPVSIALSLAKAVGQAVDFRVFGSDFHQKSLNIARQGQYDISQLADIPRRYHGFVRREKPASDKERFGLKPDLAQHLAFFSQNLMQPLVDLPFEKGSCQLIVCKNVLIYFRQFDQRDIIHRLVDYLADDGVLILGVGELPNFSNSQLKKLPYPQMNGFCKINSPIWLEQLYLGE